MAIVRDRRSTGIYVEVGVLSPSNGESNGQGKGATVVMQGFMGITSLRVQALNKHITPRTCTANTIVPKYHIPNYFVHGPLGQDYGLGRG